MSELAQYWLSECKENPQVTFFSLNCTIKRTFSFSPALGYKFMNSGTDSKIYSLMQCGFKGLVCMLV